MTALSPIDLTAPATSNKAAADHKQDAGKEKTLGQQDFLTLLVAQLQNQDPLNPADPTEFTTQLAQYSQLEQLFNLNDSMEALAKSQENTDRMTALTMIGKDVIVPGSSFELGEGSTRIGYRIDGPAAQVQIHIRNAQGIRVATLTPPATGPGTHFIDWNGMGEHGEHLEPGTYTLAIEARTPADQNASVVPLVHSRVTGVDLQGDTAMLVTDSGRFKIDDIASVTLPAEPPASQENPEETPEGSQEEESADGQASQTRGATLIGTASHVIEAAEEVNDLVTE